ncbi:MAG: carbohydrate ABC transporter permease [Anaerolineae bacterium]|nr:carbohydrate ABC transporter permease [Anaerolineae bacterium]
MTAIAQSRPQIKMPSIGAPRRRIGDALFYVVLLIIALIDIFPLLWIALSSFKTQLEIFKMPPTVFPEQFTWANYADALALLPPGQQPVSDIPSGLLNSVIISVVTTVLLLIISAMAGYAFGRINFPGRRTLLFVLLSLRMLPGIVLVVPLFMLATQLRMFDTRPLLIIVYTAFNLPFSVWLLSVFFQEVPQDLDDAARVDGCTKLSLLYHIYIPLSLPALATIGILGFMAAWNEFLFAVTLTSSIAAKTTPVALASMQSAFETRWAVMTAGAVLESIPALLLVIFAQRYIIQGLTFGAVKS